MTSAEEYLDHFKCCNMVRERVLRLNPVLKEGCIPRGWNRKETARLNYLGNGYVGKGRFIKEFGGQAWAMLKPESIRRQGRRAFVNHNTYWDMKRRTVTA